jgi:Zn-dependent protease with chaperone function/Tfp pilus assembly major pilin PilA
METRLNIDSLVYKHEKTLFTIKLVISALVWLLLIVGTVGIALIYMLFFYIAYLFAQSGLIAYLKGNGVKIGSEQFPDIYERFVSCCQKLGINEHPEIYIINGGGELNAFATKFLGRNFVVLYSNIVDAMTENPDALNFYIGHELGHIQRKHLKWAAFLSPASLLPVIGAAYSRAREYTCDQFGRACCDNPDNALRGLASLAAGDRRWATLKMTSYLEQARQTSGFWMSFHEFISDYPWLVKRAARIKDPNYHAPSRNTLAAFFSLFIPRMGSGGGIVVIVMVGILASIAIPAYEDYIVRAKVSEGLALAASAKSAVAENATDAQPFATGWTPPATTSSVSDISINEANGEITITYADGVAGTNAATLVLVPRDGKNPLMLGQTPTSGAITWRCNSASPPTDNGGAVGTIGTILPKYVPANCRG